MPENAGFVLWIHVTPGARRPSVAGLYAEAFEVPRRQIELDPGSRFRRKRVRIQGPSAGLQRRFRKLAGPA